MRPGERREQILQTLAIMLQEPGSERITTAALAARIQVSEAALYRQFASKAQMFEGLIEFIDRSLFSLINRITSEPDTGLKQLENIIRMMLTFAKKNPGMTRVLIGDALVTEDPRLAEHINQLLARIGLALKQTIRTAVADQSMPVMDATIVAGNVMALVLGKWVQFSRSGFRMDPLEGIDYFVRGLTVGATTSRSQPNPSG